MPDGERRLQKEYIQALQAGLRIPAGYSGFYLVNYLNGRLVRDNRRRGPDNTCGDRAAVAELVHRLQRLENLLSENQEERSDSEYDETLNWINWFINRHPITRSFEGGRSQAALEWDMYLTVPGDRTSPENIEWFMTLCVMELFRSGRISALKKCARCGEWLFAQFSHQRFCKEECRKQFHTSNPADKKMRADWARKKYWQRKKKAK